jgi:hypothetical protein
MRADVDTDLNERQRSHGRLIGRVGGSIVAALGALVLVVGLLVPVAHGAAFVGGAWLLIGLAALWQSHRRASSPE